MLAAGIDIGTTTVSAAVIDTATGRSAATRTAKNVSAIESPYLWDRRQDAERLYSSAKELLDSLLMQFPDISAIGFTGQMHGILYVGADGIAVSPLYTWQDGRADLSPDGEMSTCDLLFDLTGYKVPAGYGLATHAHISRWGEAPERASKLCTIMDYAVSRLTGTVPVSHCSNAASLGLFNVFGGAFDTDAVRRAGIDHAILPEVTCDKVAGEYRGIPVAVAIGDNQAAVFGTVGERDDIAVANIGTGSQISVVMDGKEAENVTITPDVEVRPYVFGKYLSGGSALCGGRAYAVLERFYRSFSAAIGIEGDMYELMGKLAAAGMEKAENDPASALSVCTSFCGSRTDPSKRGSIDNIGEENFTPEYLTAGVISGIARELHELYLAASPGKVKYLAASGNAARLNESLCSALEKTFKMKVCLSEYGEEAARGAAMFAARVKERV